MKIADLEQERTDNLILVLNLHDKSMKGVLSVIELLKNYPSVLYAEPSYIIGAIDVDNIIAPDGARSQGDINYDGRVNNQDIIILARYIVRLTSLTYTQLSCADMNGDSKVNNSDLLCLQERW
jgi:hypothetical protein